MKRIAVVTFVWMKNDGSWPDLHKSTNVFKVEEKECDEFRKKIKSQFASHKQLSIASVKFLALSENNDELILTTHRNKTQYKFHSSGKVLEVRK